MGYYSEKILATSGLLSYWKLDEASGSSAADSKGSSPGTYTGATLGRAGFGHLGPAPLFSKTGTSNAIITTNASAMVTTSWTWECWLYLNSFNTGDSFTSFFANGNGTSWGRFGRINASTAQIEAGFQDTGGTAHQGFNGPTVSLATWTHVAVTYDTTSGNLIAYKNGAGAVTLLTYNALAPKSTVYEVSLTGRWNGTDAFRLDGELQHHAIYNTALSAATLLDHYNTGAADFGLPAPGTPHLQAVNRAASF